MSHRRFFVPGSSITADQATIIDRDDIKHIKNVLRLKIGDELTILNGEGKVYNGIITSLRRDSIDVKLGEPTFYPSSLRVITLIQSLPKDRKMEYIIRGGTEMGVRRIIPLITSRSIPSPPGRSRLLRWRRVAKAAAQLSGRPYIPMIDEGKSIEEVLKERFDLALVLYEEERRRMLRDVLGSLDPDPVKIGLFVGPEGGFTQKEIDLLKTHGVLPCSLGEFILRVEVVSLVALSIILYEFGEIG